MLKDRFNQNEVTKNSLDDSVKSLYKELQQIGKLLVSDETIKNLEKEIEELKKENINRNLGKSN